MKDLLQGVPENMKLYNLFTSLLSPYKQTKPSLKDKIKVYDIVSILCFDLFYCIILWDFRITILSNLKVNIIYLCFDLNATHLLMCLNRSTYCMNQFALKLRRRVKKM